MTNQKVQVSAIIFAAILLLLWLYKPEPSAPVTDSVISTEGMVKIPSGTTFIGSREGLANEQPEFKTEVESFYLDKNLVTVANFRAFVDATNYLTEADKIGDAVVFNL
ncbi:hypothetical protein BH23BAC3_BH23BAC3_04250 [soil metagenome]